MKKTINYEKDILFKTSIGSICSISLEHDFTLDDGKLKGDFIVSGDYKINELSVNKEPFNFRLPLEYELDMNVDLSTLSYEVENFEYNVKDDVLTVYIDLGVRYEEFKTEPIMPEVDAKEMDFDEIILNSINEEAPKNDEKEERKEEVQTIEEEVELPRLKSEDENTIINSVTDDDAYINYHVHIVREGDTLESIASKYKVSIELIKEYNNFESLELKDKLIIPEVNE